MATPAPKPAYGELSETAPVPGLTPAQISSEYLALDKTDRAARTTIVQMFGTLGALLFVAVGIPLVIIAWKIALGW